MTMAGRFTLPHESGLDGPDETTPILRKLRCHASLLMRVSSYGNAWALKTFPKACYVRQAEGLEGIPKLSNCARPASAGPDLSPPRAVTVRPPRANTTKASTSYSSS